MLMALGEQKSIPMERPESGVVAVLQMPAKPVKTDELPIEMVHWGSVKISMTIALARDRHATRSNFIFMVSWRGFVEEVVRDT